MLYTLAEAALNVISILCIGVIIWATVALILKSPKAPSLNPFRSGDRVEVVSDSLLKRYNGTVLGVNGDTCTVMLDDPTHAIVDLPIFNFHWKSLLPEED